MKLIDMLVEELPKRGGWPKKVTHIGQDYDSELMFYGRGNVRSGIFLDQLAVDHRKHREAGTKITREQYEAALAAKNEGWIEWGGGECPVSDSTMVEVRYRNGEVMAAYPADFYEWGHGSYYFVNTDFEIIAYRLHQPQEAEQAKADGEADMNECASQDAAPVWSGEGLPPVGMKVEWLSDKYGWLGGTVAAHDAKYPLVAIIRHNDGYTGCHRHELRTEAERKRDAAVEIMTQILCSPSQASATAKKIYEAIAAGKIPGVKLEGL